MTATRPFAGDTTLPSTAWHPQFEDVNNDGFMDLFVAKGNVYEMPDYARRDPSNLLLGQADGTFIEGAQEAGIMSFDRGRGAAVADLNLDGLLDIVQVNFGAPVQMWRSTGSGAPDNPAMGHWLAVQLSEPGPNRDAIGSWIEVKAGDSTIERELTVGGGHVSGRLGPTHFGLGAADRAEVRVTWPDGEQGPWIPVEADQYVTLDRGAEQRRRGASRDRRPGLQRSICPTSACPTRRRNCRRRSMPTASNACGSERRMPASTAWSCTRTASTARTCHT